jgi:hypothetical protein
VPFADTFYFPLLICRYHHSMNWRFKFLTSSMRSFVLLCDCRGFIYSLYN